MPAHAAGKKQGVDRAFLDPRIDHDDLGRGVGQRVVLRPGGGDGPRAEAAVGAALVVRDDLLAEDPRHQPRQFARVDVIAAARGIADDKRDGSAAVLFSCPFLAAFRSARAFHAQD